MKNVTLVTSGCPLAGSAFLLRWPFRIAAAKARAKRNDLRSATLESLDLTNKIKAAKKTNRFLSKRNYA